MVHPRCKKSWLTRIICQLSNTGANIAEISQQYQKHAFGIFGDAITRTWEIRIYRLTRTILLERICLLKTV